MCICNHGEEPAHWSGNGGPRRPALWLRFGVAATVERAVRYVEAGADCVFVPRAVQEDTIRRLAEAIPGPLNVVAGLANLIDAPTLFALGVKRVSLGGSLARAALSMLERAGRELLYSGTLGFLDGAIGYADLQRRFRS